MRLATLAKLAFHMSIIDLNFRPEIQTKVWLAGRACNHLTLDYVVLQELTDLLCLLYLLQNQSDTRRLPFESFRGRQWHSVPPQTPFGSFPLPLQVEWPFRNLPLISGASPAKVFLCTRKRRANTRSASFCNSAAMAGAISPAGPRNAAHVPLRRETFLPTVHRASTASV
ncbi:hypothetical protein PSACC_03498 [Paramicrosporidium saccamoebae]|uniref:Uncharacterized protein n=1 Tax=Paramicrosporidium saccamoebae TaxID=1246581 RepID=A0A2H9TG70_9FUNG|nr:hypothetical protein PSACC_03498 [Paramicrosporidium saccamoebae]